MKAFIKQCIFFGGLFFVLEKSLVFLRNSLPEKELDKRLEYVINGKVNADIVVIGSSRGARDIVASQLAEELHTTAYNLSYPGSDIQFHEYLLNELLKKGNKKPKLLILAVDDASELKEDPTITFRLDRLYPLVKYKCIRNTLIERGEKNKILSELFIIHQLNIGDFDLRKKRFTNVDTLFSDGSMPVSWQSKNFNRCFETRTIVYNRNEEKQNKLKSFMNVVKMCRDNNITLLLAYAPNFGSPTIGFKQRLTELAKNNYVMQYDTTNPVYCDADCYYDFAHLKRNGATIFTSEIAAFIKQYNILNTSEEKVAEQDFKRHFRQVAR